MEQAGPASQPEHLLEQVSSQVLEGALEDQVAYLSELLATVMAEVDEVFDVVVGADVLGILTMTRGPTFVFDTLL